VGMTAAMKSRRRTSERSGTPRTAVVGGGAGFLGAHLCARLLRADYRVICVDNFCTSEAAAVEHLLTHGRFQLVEQDIAALDVDEFGAVDNIFNLACAASPVLYQQKPLDTLFSSVNGTDNLLRMALRHGATLFQASTSEIYGHPTVHPQTESYWGHCNSFGPRSCYDEGKRCAETLCYIYRQQHGVNVRVARIFNTYGPGMRLRDGRVVINFIRQALSDTPITVYGDGRQTRSFCFVDDLIEGIMRLNSPGNSFSGPVNLGNPVEIPVADLAERIVRITGSRSRIDLQPLPVDDPPRRRPDITLATRELGWRPQVDLDTGLKLTIRDVERRMAANEFKDADIALPVERTAPAAGVTAL
jgi:UDP-glucuronate decarboxylase